MRSPLRQILPILVLLLTPQLALAALPATPDWTLESDRQSHGLGWSVHTAGDVNGDGYSDVIVGALGATTGSAAAYLYLGGATGSPFQPSRLAWQKLNFSVQVWVSAAGDVNNDGYGDVAVAWGTVFRVYYGNSGGLDTTNFFFQNQSSPQGFYFLRTAPAGDVNGDGYDDVLLSNSEFGGSFSPCNNDWTGRATLYYGSASGLNAASTWSVCGNGLFTRLGAGLAGAGDINGDGYGDFVLGSPGEGTEGRARVMFGSAAGPTFGPNLAGDQAGMAFGASVAGAGDVNGDGYADVIVGGPGRDYTGANNAGSAYVYAGQSTGINTTPLWFEWGASADDEFGAAVSSAGDLDGDGYAEIVVGAPFWTNGQSSEGQVAVWNGSSFGPSPTSWFPESNGQGAQMAAAVCPGGDIDGDGLGELIVGLPGWANPTFNEGAVWIYRGRGEVPNANLPTTWFGAQNTGYLGWSVSRAGDFNGDGYDDAVVGEPLFDVGASADHGRVLLYLGSSTGLPGSPSGERTGVNGSNHGIAVACAGDVNGDGRADFVAGSHQLGAATVFYGNESGSLTLAQDVWGDFQPGDYFGGSVTGGDLNGDGYSDLIVGSPGWDGPLGADQGRVHVFLSPGPGAITTGQAAVQIIEGSQAGENFGSGVAFVGDLDRDGRGDVVIGASHYDQPPPIIGLPPLTDAGRISVRLGRAGGLSAQVYGSAGDEDLAYFGGTVSAAGDVDNDGHADLLAGGYGYLDHGMFRLFHGGPAGIAFWLQVEGPQQFASGFGSSVSAAGDVNADGYGDVLVGAVFFDGLAQDDGRMFLYLGGPFGIAAPSWFKDGGQFFANLGHAVAGVGDVNGDGFDDVAGGAPGFDFDGVIPQSGYVQTFLGNSGGGFAHPMVALKAGGASNAVEGGLTSDPDEYVLRGMARSPAGRTRVRMEWVNERANGAAGAIAGFGPWYATAAPAPGVGSSILVTQGVGGLAANTAYGWRGRFRTRSVYFPTTPWMLPGVNGAKIADLRTGPTLVAVDPTVVASGVLEFAAPRPNPFRGDVALEFSLPQAGDTRIDIVDTQGRRVRRLAEGTRAAGRHRLAWDGRDEHGAELAAGIYFVTLDAMGERKTQRVVRLP